MALNHSGPPTNLLLLILIRKFFRKFYFLYSFTVTLVLLIIYGLVYRGLNRLHVTFGETTNSFFLFVFTIVTLYYDMSFSDT